MEDNQEVSKKFRSKQPERARYRGQKKPPKYRTIDDAALTARGGL